MDLTAEMHEAPCGTTAARVFVINKQKMRSHAKSCSGCLACKARRVKCQETRPSCRNCVRRGATCVYSSPHSHDSWQEQDAQPRATPTKIVRPRGLAPPGWSGEESVALLDSIRYYNTCIVPDMHPASPPFKREEISPLHFSLLPGILQRLFIVTSQTIRAAKDGVDPMSRPELCRYRGLCLHELSESLQDASTDPYGITLTAILILMLSDMQIYCEGLWSCHLEAARWIITRRGGLEKCLETLPGIRGLLANFVVVDILTATTCSGSLLRSRSTQAQSRYIPFLPLLEEDIISSVVPCPQEVLQAIAHTNVFRASSPPSPDNDPRDSTQLHTFEAILKSIEDFDPRAWAARVSNYGRTLPPRESNCVSVIDITGLTSLAICYKSAATLYLLLSSHTYVGAELQARINCAEHTLSSQIRFLFEIASIDAEGPLHTQMWKFLVWPLVVHIYVRVSWNAGDEPVGRDLDHARSTALSLGSRSLLQAVELMGSVQVKRGANLNATWVWDNGFTSRYAFVI